MIPITPEAHGEGGGPLCCGPKRNTVQLGETQPEKRRLGIEFLYLDLSICTRCQGAEVSLEEAISEVTRVLEAIGVEVAVNKIHIQSEKQARELEFISSPTIRINGRDIQLDVKESLCEVCSDLICGESVDCRVWVYQGKEYTAPPKAMIIDAILREVYGGAKQVSDVKSRTGDVPDNLKRFFATSHKKKETGLGRNKDLPSKRDRTCCGPSAPSKRCG